MAVSLSAIKSAAKQGVKTASESARGASTIDEALELQAEGIAEAIRQAFETFLAQAKVNGGICSNGGPIANATIT